MKDDDKTNQRWAFEANLGFFVALLTLLTLGIMTFRDTQNLVSAAGEASHHQEVHEAIQNLLVSISESEKAETVYHITGDTQFLRDDPSLGEIDLAFTRLRTLASGNREKQSRLAVLAGSLDRKSTLWREISRNRQHEKSHMEAVSNALKAESVTLHDLLKQMAEDEDRVLQTDSRESQAHASRATNTLLLLSGFMVLFLSLAYRAMVNDIRARQQVEAKLMELTRLDALTGLVNRRAFYEALEHERARMSRYKHPVTIAFIDLDDFKQVNDLHGHAVGDMVLRKVATTIRENLRKTDTVARVGGDEFAVLLPETGASAAECVLRKAQQALHEEIRSESWNVSLSIGGVTHLIPGESSDEMVRQADALMYAVKASGKNSLSVVVLG